MSTIPLASRPMASAPVADLTGSEDSQARSIACATCVRRKVKCDRAQPCSTCRTGRFTCEYPDPTPRKRKRKDFEELQDRLDRYEQLLTKNGLMTASDGQSVAQIPTPRSSVAAEPKPLVIAMPHVSHSSETKLDPQNGRLVSGPAPGQTRYVESYLWEELGQDLHPASDNEDESEVVPTPAHNPTAHTSPADLVSAGLFGASTPSYNLADLHPSPQVAMKLWQMFLRNIDPILKCVHGPSTTKMFESVFYHAGPLSKETECLFFAIYHFAIISMTDEEGQELLGPSWSDAQRTYHDATRQSLLGCSFYQTTSFAVLQAYTLLLISMRYRYNPHTFWILCGIALRLAQRMGLHTEDEGQLSPFDVQMRRRLWWYILMTDQFAANQSGTNVGSSSTDFWDAPHPLNIDDTGIWPGMAEPPHDKRAATDMMMYLGRLEITAFRAKLRKRSPAELEAALNVLEDTIEGKFLRYCDVTDPTHYLILVGTRAAVLNARLRSRLTKIKAGKASDVEKKELFTLGLKLLDYHVALTASPLTSRFAWQTQAFFSWEPLIFALQELCKEQDPVQAESAWEKVGRVMEGHPNLATPTRSIELAIGRLAMRAWDLQQRRSALPRQEPAFINSLRQYFWKRTEARKGGSSVPTPQKSTMQQSVLEPSADLLLTDDSLLWDDSGPDIDWNLWDDLIRNSALESASF